MTSEDFGVWIGGAAAAGSAFTLGLSKFIRMIAGDHREITAVSAERDVIAMLRKEVERLSIQNEKLARTVEELQNKCAACFRRDAECRTRATDPVRIEAPMMPPFNKGDSL